MMEIIVDYPSGKKVLSMKGSNHFIVKAAKKLVRTKGVSNVDIRKDGKIIIYNKELLSIPAKELEIKLKNVNIKSILITGGSGFIAHNLIKYFIKNTNFKIYAHYRSSCSKIPIHDRINIFQCDLNDDMPALPKFDYMIHTAANTYVPDSLEDSIPFIKDNVLATANLLEWVKNKQPQARICIFSSDEVLGPAKDNEFFREDSALKPSSPYSASKACQEMLAHAFAHSFGLDIFCVRPMNAIGEGERDYKFIGKTLKAIMEGKKIILHGSSKENVASRHWVYTQDIASAIHILLDKAKPKEIYHISGEEMDVYTMASKIFRLMKGKDMTDSDVQFINFKDARPGHDKRYSLSDDKLVSLGWNVKTPLNEVIKRIVEGEMEIGD